MIDEFIQGDTLRIEWINSGAAPSAVTYSIWTSIGSFQSVGSGPLTNSGNGHYYADYTTPTSPGYYVAKTSATIAGKPYIRAMKFKVISMEVD